MLNQAEPELNQAETALKQADAALNRLQSLSEAQLQAPSLSCYPVATSQTVKGHYHPHNHPGSMRCARESGCYGMAAGA